MRIIHWNHYLSSFDESKLNNDNGRFIVIINKQALVPIDTKEEQKMMQQI